MQILELNKAYLDWCLLKQEDEHLKLGEYLANKFNLTDDTELLTAPNELALTCCQKHIDLNPEPAHKAEASDTEEGE